MSAPRAKGKELPAQGTAKEGARAARAPRIDSAWYEANPDKVESARGEAEVLHAVAAAKVEESLDSVFEELGIARAGYTFRYLNESLTEGEYGLFVLVTETTRDINAPEPVVVGQRKAGDERNRKAAIWSNYSEELTQALRAKFADDNLEVKIKAIVYGNADGDPVERAEEASEQRAFSKVRPPALVDYDIDFGALITREQLRNHALSPELDILGRAGTLLKAAKLLTKRANEGSSLTKEQELISYVALEIAEEIGTKLLKARAIESNLNRIPSTKEIEAVGKIRAHAKLNPQKTVRLSDINASVSLDAAEARGLERILFELEKLAPDTEFSWDTLSTRLKDYAKGGEYDTRYMNLSAIARLVLPEGTKLPGGKTASGLFDETGTQTEQDIANALEAALIDNVINKNKNFVNETIFNRNGLNLVLPTKENGDVDYEHIKNRLAAANLEKKEANPQLRILEERVRTDVTERTDAVESDVNNISQATASIQAKLNEQGLAALSSYQEADIQQLNHKITTIEERASGVVLTLNEILAETAEHNLSEPETAKITTGFDAYLKRIDAVQARIQSLRSTIDTFLKLRSQIDSYKVEVLPEAVAEAKDSAKQVAKLAKESVKVEKSLQKEQAEVTKYSLLKEFAYFGDTELVFEANELYLQCLEKVVESGWEAASAEIESFKAFVTANADEKYHQELLATVASFEAFSIELSPADRGRRLLDLGRELMGRVTNAVSIPKYIELVLGWAGVMLISQNISILISQYGMSMNNETVLEALKHGGLVLATAIGVADLNAKAAIGEAVANVKPGGSHTSTYKSLLGLFTVLSATSIISNSIQASELQAATADSIVAATRGPAIATRESLAKAETISQDYQSQYQKVLSLHTVGVIITETGIGAEQLPFIKSQLMESGFYTSEADIAFGTPGKPGVGPVTLKKIFALYGEVPLEIDVAGGTAFSLVNAEGVSYREIYDDYYANRPVFKAEIDRITSARSELMLGAKERVTDRVATLYGEFVAQDVGATIEAPLEKYFEAVDRIEQLKSLRAQLVTLFLHGEKPNRYDLERYAIQTNQEIDVAIVELTEVANDIKRLQEAFNDTLQTVDAAISLPDFDESALLPKLEKLDTELEISKIPEPTDQLQVIMDSLLPDQYTARLIAEAEAKRLAPEDPVRQREIVEEIEAWNVSVAWAKGFMVVLSPLLLLTIPNALLIARSKRKRAGIEVVKMKEVLKQDARKIASHLNVLLQKQAVNQSFPKIESYMVHRVLIDLATKMDTESLGVDGEAKDGVVKEWLYSMVRSISDDADTRSASAARRIAGRARGESEQGLAVYVLDRLIPGYTKRLREYAVGIKSGEVGEAFESKNLALHYAERVKFIQGRLASLEAHRMRFGSNSANYVELLRPSAEMTGSGQEQRRRYLAIERAIERAERDLKEAEVELSRNAVGAAVNKGSRGQLVVPDPADFTFTAHPLAVPTGMLEYAEDEILEIENEINAAEIIESVEAFEAVAAEVDTTTADLNTEYDGVEITSVASLFNPRTNSSTITTTIRPSSADTAINAPITLTVTVASSANKTEVAQEVRRKVSEAIAYEHAIQRELKNLSETLRNKYPQTDVTFNFEGLFGTKEKTVAFTILDTKSGSPIVESQKLRLSANISGETFAKAMEGKADQGVITTMLRAQIEKAVEGLIVAHRELEQDVSEAAHLFAANSAEYLFMPEFTIVETPRGYAVAMSVSILDGSKSVHQSDYEVPLSSDNVQKTRREVAQLLKQTMRTFVESVKVPRAKAALEAEFTTLRAPASKPETVQLKNPFDIKNATGDVGRLFRKEEQRIKSGLAKSVFQKITVGTPSVQANLEQSIASLLPDSTVTAVRNELNRIVAADVPTLPSQEQLFRFVTDETARAQSESSPVKFALFYGSNPSAATLGEQLYLTIKRDGKKPPTVEYVDMATVKASVKL